ncbi:DNA lyase [Apiospora saccharicola]|uniref:DNA lyase n=1 Tax=Apiospora saccharicola TaxID=335842 RepID=A0ABR1WKK8_9PEZI
MDELADWVYPHHAMPVEYGWSMLRRRQVTTEESEPEPCVAGPPSAFRQPAAFRGLVQQHNFDAHKHCVPHGSYLFNLAAAENVKAYQGYDSFIDDLHRCESLGNVLYNSHSGNTKGGTMPMQTETSRWALQPI